MNIANLHSFVTQQFREIQPDVDLVFASAKQRSAAGRKINLNPFLSELHAATKPHRVRVFGEIQNEVSVANLGVQWYPQLGGFCYEPNQKNFARIEIVICTHQSSRRLDLTPEGWNHFRFRFLKTLLHELVHRAQFAHGRKGSTLIFRPHAHALLDKYHLLEQQYLGDLDEVEAYARDCVEDWYYLHPSQPLTTRKLREEFRDSRKIISLTYYHDVFQGDLNHPAIKRMFRKVMAWNEILTPISRADISLS